MMLAGSAMDSMAEETTTIGGNKKNKKKKQQQQLQRQKLEKKKQLEADYSQALAADGLSVPKGKKAQLVAPSFSKAVPKKKKKMMKRKAADGGSEDEQEQNQTQKQTKRAKPGPTMAELAAKTKQASLLRKGAQGVVKKPVMPGPSMAELAAAPVIEDTDDESDDVSTGDDAPAEQPAAAESSSNSSSEEEDDESKPLRKSPRLAAAAAAPPSDDFGLDDAAEAEGMDFDLDETVTGAAVRGATLDIVDDAAKGTPLEDFDMLEQTSAILRKRGILKLFPIQSETYSKGQNTRTKTRTHTHDFQVFSRQIAGVFCSRGRQGRHRACQDRPGQDARVRTADRAAHAHCRQSQQQHTGARPRTARALPAPDA